jgi:ribonuclease Z
MDHFIGFDTLIRVFLGRDKALYLFGPPGFLAHVQGKLAGYTWNLVHEYENDFRLIVHEVHQDAMFVKTFVCQDRFKAPAIASKRSFHGTLLEEPHFLVQGILLDHRIPCLGLSLTESYHVNILKEALEKMNLPVGPWLNRFKEAVYQQKDTGTEFVVTWREQGQVTQQRRFVLGDLVEKIARISPGQKIVYITDALDSPENARKIIELAKGADMLFIEAAFLDREKQIARKKYHLTARKAGCLARKAEVRQFEIFHFSPRYRGHADELEREARQAFDQ